MSLDVHLKDPTATYDTDSLYNANITHNLGEMAAEAGIYEALWRPYRFDPAYDEKWDNTDKEYEFEETHDIYAHQLITVIEIGLKMMKTYPDYYKEFDAENGWGIYDHFVPWIEQYLEALREFPKSKVVTDR